jgi:hypothetical protein
VDARGLLSLPATVSVAVGDPPTATQLPVVTGEAREGATLTATAGVWTGTPPLTHAYQWRRCNANGAECADLAAATGTAYVAARADVGQSLRVRVTVTGPAGLASADSAPTGPIAPALGGPPPPPDPGPTTPPVRRLTIRGTARADDLLGTSLDEDIFGRAGDDTMLGLGGADRLWGGPGDDVILGGPGRDFLFGGRGSDVLRARDGQPDAVTCGTERDVALVDDRDRTDPSCETVLRRRRA